MSEAVESETLAALEPLMFSPGTALLNYAIAGSTCSWDIVKRDTAAFGVPPKTSEDFLSVHDHLLPSFLAGLECKDALHVGGRTAKNTVYALWVGGNNFGTGGFFSGQNEEGTTLTSLVHCQRELFDEAYDISGRRFVVLGTQALEHAPQYLPEDILPVDPKASWAHISTFGIPDWTARMREYTTSINMMLNYGLAYQKLSVRWPGATVTYFDAHTLLCRRL
ncbi:hypothetical protein BJX65DRAFT_314467 [Aspergillus insuetus]